jgi:hypothetical protein
VGGDRSAGSAVPPKIARKARLLEGRQAQLCFVALDAALKRRSSTVLPALVIEHGASRTFLLRPVTWKSGHSGAAFGSHNDFGL